MSSTASRTPREARGDERGTARRRVPVAARPPILDSVCVGLAALAAYLLLAQDTLYKTDGHYQLVQVTGGRVQHPLHFLYGPVLWTAIRALEPFGISPYRAGTLLSAGAMAAGIAFCHRSFAILGLPRARCALAALLVAWTPAIVFFATVVELHAVFFACAGIAFVAAARLVEHPTTARGAVLGLATGLAYLAHATGVLLLPFLAAVCAALAGERDVRPRALLGPLVAFVAVHAAVMLGVPRLLHEAQFTVSVESASNYFFVNARRNLVQPALYPLALWQEWVTVLAPLSLAWLPGAAVRGGRVIGAVFAASIVMYVAATLGVMGAESEWGAYVLPLAWPAALLVARVGPRWWGGVVLAGCAAAAIALVAGHDTRPSRPFAQGLAEVAAGRSPVLIIGNHRELEALLVYHPDVASIVPLEWVELDPELFAARGAELLDGWVREQWAAGRDVFLTAGARSFLTDPAYAEQRPAGPAILAHFERAYRLEHVAAAGFVADLLRPR